MATSGKLERSDIDALFPEALDASKWAEFDTRKAREEIVKLDADIAFLRGADFKDLVAATRFTQPTDNGETFSGIVDRTLKSELAVELVKHGYLDLNFALYAAQFYGDFTGVDVATFIVQTVQTNSMNIDHQFSGPDAIANLLDEAPDYFPETISAYNIAVLDYLLERNDACANRIAGTIATDFGEDAETFLRAYFNSGAWRERFAAQLAARPWREVFTFLVGDQDIPNEIKPVLVDAGLRASTRYEDYRLGAEVRDFVIENYRDMPLFTDHLPVRAASDIVSLLKHMGVVLPSLAGLSTVIGGCIVEEQLYRLTADNLREALGGIGDISIDRVRQNADVYDFCLKRPGEYLAAIESDSENTSYAVSSETALIDVLTKIDKTWETDHASKFIAKVGPDCRVTRLDSVPTEWWPILADYHLFSATAGNVLSYLQDAGSFDQSVADLILQAGSIDATGADADTRMRVAVEVLNASGMIPEARRRVALVDGLDLELPIPVAELTPESGELLALLLEQGWVEDSLETFLHFRSAGRGVFELAIAHSKRFEAFMTPELLDGFVADVLNARRVPEQIRDKIIDNLAQYARDDATTLTAGARYFIERGRSLPTVQVNRVAAATRDANLTMQLLNLATPSPVEIVSALNALGEPYANLTTRQEAEFEAHFEDKHRRAFERVFGHLKRASVIARYEKQRLRNVFTVTLK